MVLYGVGLVVEKMLWGLTSCKGEAGCSRILCVEGLNKLRLFLFSPIYTLAFASTHSFVIIIAAALGMVHMAHAFEHKTHDRMYGASSPLESHKTFVNKGKFRPRKFIYSDTVEDTSKGDMPTGSKLAGADSETAALRCWTTPTLPATAISEQVLPTEALHKSDLSDMGQAVFTDEAKTKKKKKRKKHKKHKKAHGSKKTAVRPV